MSIIALWFVVWLIFVILDNLPVPGAPQIKWIMALVIILVVFILGPDFTWPAVSLRR